jgi:hypothetical protein
VDGEPTPRACTVHVPIRAYAGNDAVARDRIEAVLASLAISAAPYHAAIEALAERPLSAGVGLHAWVSLRMEETGPRVSLYLSAEAMSVELPRADYFPTPFRSPEKGKRPPRSGLRMWRPGAQPRTMGRTGTIVQASKFGKPCKHQ